MSVTIAINSSTDQAAVALISGTKILAEKSWASHRDEAEKIIPAITGLLKKSKKNWKDVKKVFVINGPGPFTSLRVGVTIANAIAWATKSKVYTATTAELQKIFIVSPQKSFGQTALQLLKKSSKASKIAKPLYLKKPHITTSKKIINYK